VFYLGILLQETMQRHLFPSILSLCLLSSLSSLAQTRMLPTSNPKGQFSLGARSTISAFDKDGIGMGTGGQFRIRFGQRVNSDWFADYITINAANGIRSTYYHVGWSVLFYPFLAKTDIPRFEPYIVAGHCFDYNRKTVLTNPEISRGRWGSAVQTGLGLHCNITDKVDLSLSSQYMIHLTKEFALENHGGTYEFHDHSHNALQGHLLTTLSINYKIGKK
jgi:Outer membrane protein beta-barrel domain